MAALWLNIVWLVSFLLQRGESITCSSTSQCANDHVTETAAAIYCSGYQACYQSSIQITTTSSYHIYCYGYWGCGQAKNVTNELGYVFCLGAYSCYGADSIRALASNRHAGCYGYFSCAYALIEHSYTVYCTGERGCYRSTIEGATSVYVWGYFAAYDATITSEGLVSGTTMSLYLYGQTSGSYSNLICYDAGHTCYLYCDGNGCNNALVNSTAGSGTWVVSCDDDENIDCPDGYTAPTSAPTGGALETIYCRDSFACDYQSLYGYSLFCDGYYGCRGSSSYSLQSATGPIYCRGYYGCFDVGSIKSASSIDCSGAWSCYDVENITSTTGGDISCSSTSSCYGSEMYLHDSSYVNCHGDSSCALATINGGDRIHGYGQSSLDGSYIINANSIFAWGSYSLNYATIEQYNGTLTIYFYGFTAGYGADIYCYSGATCYINCFGNSCSNVDIDICAGECIIDCDESNGISCPNGYTGPTPGPTEFPTPIPTYRPTNRPSSNPTDSPSPLPTEAPTSVIITTTEGSDSNGNGGGSSSGSSGEVSTTAGEGNGNTNSCDGCECNCETSETTDDGLSNDSGSLASITSMDNAASYIVFGLVILCLILALIIVGLCIKLKEYKQSIADMSKLNPVPTKSPSDMPIKNGHHNHNHNHSNNNNDDNEDSLLGKIDLQAPSAPRMATNQSGFSTVPPTNSINTNFNNHTNLGITNHMHLTNVPSTSFSGNNDIAPPFANGVVTKGGLPVPSDNGMQHPAPPAPIPPPGPGGNFTDDGTAIELAMHADNNNNNNNNNRGKLLKAGENSQRMLGRADSQYYEDMYEGQEQTGGAMGRGLPRQPSSAM